MLAEDSHAAASALVEEIAAHGVPGCALEDACSFTTGAVFDHVGRAGDLLSDPAHERLPLHCPFHWGDMSAAQAGTGLALPRPQHRRGLVLMLGATLCWATAGVLVRSQSVRDGWEVTFWRSFFMVLFMTGVLVVQYRADTLRRVRAIGLPGLVSGALWAIMFIAFILALSRTTVANTLVLCSISPFMSAVVGWLALSERVPLRTWIAMAAAFAGIALMFVDSLGAGGTAGNLIALGDPRVLRPQCHDPAAHAGRRRHGAHRAGRRPALVRHDPALRAALRSARERFSE